MLKLIVHTQKHSIGSRCTTVECLFLFWAKKMEPWLILAFWLPLNVGANGDSQYYQSPEIQEQFSLLSQNVLSHLHDSHSDAYNVAINAIVFVSLQGVVTISKFKILNKCFSDNRIIEAIEYTHSNQGVLYAAEILSSAIQLLSLVFDETAQITTNIILEEIVIQATLR